MTDPKWTSDGQVFATDAATEEARKAEVEQYQRIVRAYERRTTSTQALNVANFGRAYLGVSPEVAAAVAETNIPWDMPEMRDIFTKDAVVQDNLWQTFQRNMRGGVRNTLAYLDSTWDMGYGHLMRTGINAYQGSGDNLVENWRRAGSSYTGQAARDIAQGREVRFGHGWTPGPTPVEKYEGFGDRFLENYQSIAGDEFTGGVLGPTEDAYRKTMDEFVAEYGISTTQRAWDSQEATIISSTRNGRTYAAPFSFGRAPAVYVSTPGTLPFNLLSGTIDGTLRVGWDPLNVPAWELSKVMRARKLFQPLEGELVAGVTEVAPPQPRPGPVGRVVRTVDPDTTTWNLADDVEELRRVQDELDDFHDAIWGPPSDEELAAIDAGIPYLGPDEKAMDPRLVELETMEQALMDKLRTAGIYLMPGQRLSADLLDSLADAARDMRFVEFVDIPARGKYADPGDIGPGAEGLVFHGGPNPYDPERPFRGGISLRADRAIDYAGGVGVGELGGDIGYIYVYNKADFADDVVRHLDEVGDIEQIYSIPTGDPDEIRRITEINRTLDGYLQDLDDLEEISRTGGIRPDDARLADELDVPTFPKSPDDILTERRAIKTRMQDLHAELDDIVARSAGMSTEEFQRLRRVRERLDEIGFYMEDLEHFDYRDVSGDRWDELRAEEKFLLEELNDIETKHLDLFYMQNVNDSTLITGPMPDPVAVYPAPDFHQTVKTGKLQVPGPTQVIEGGGGGTLAIPPTTPTGPPPTVHFTPTASQVGIVDSWRPYADPIKVSDWLANKPSGQRLLAYLAQANLSEVAAILGDLPEDALKAIARADTPAAVADELLPHLGVTVRQRPQIPRTFGRPVLGSTFYGEGLAANGVTRVRESPFGRFYRMLADTTDMLQLNPDDVSRTIVNVNRRLLGWGVDPEKIDDVLWAIADADETGHMLDVYTKIMDLFEDRLLTKRVFGQQYDPVEVRQIMQAFLDDQARAISYTEDLVGNPINPEGARVWSHTTPNGNTIEIPIGGAHLETEFANGGGIYIPSGKETRRTLSSVRVVTDQFRRLAGEVAGPIRPEDASTLREAVGFIDGRPRAAWGSLKRSRGQIVLDFYLASWRNLALLRLGWLLRYLPDEAARFMASGEFTGPASYFRFLMDHGHQALNGQNLDDVLKAKGLGAAAFPHRFDDTLVGSRFDAARTWWSTARRGQPGYQRGLAREAVQVSKSVLAREVAVRGLDDAFAYFQTGPGKQILQPIVNDAARGSRLARILDDSDVLYDVLAEAEWRTAKVTGGHGYYRNGDDMVWRDAFGVEVEDYSTWTMERMRGKATADQLPGRSKPATVAEMRRFLMNADGTDVLLDLPPHRNFYVDNPGSRRAARFLLDGTDDAGKPIIKETMVNRDWTELEMIFEKMITDEGFETPLSVKVPSLAHAGRLQEAGNSFVEFGFRFLGQIPTVKLIRSPYAKSVYVDEIARIYLFGNQATRGRLLKWADDIGLADEFDTMIKRHMHDRNMSKLPTGGMNIDLNAADQVARSVAVEASRELFYDLTKVQNWADLGRIYAPFAEAWWEVITRWAKLLNPMQYGGRAVLNWRRASQAAMGAKRSGWFEEDAYGNEVFSWFPQFGTAIPFLSPDTGSENVQVENQVGLERLLFVDPSDPGSLLKPGGGPPAQLLGALVEPLLPTSVQDEFRSFVFGEFTPPDIQGDLPGALFQAHAPTWIRRALDAWYAENDRAERADLTVKVYEALVLSGDPRFEALSKEQSDAVMRHARGITGRLTWARIIDGLLGPSQQYEAEFLASIGNTKNPEFWMNVRAVGEEMRWAEEFYGSEEAAISYILERYGFNPLDTGPATQFIADFPMGKDGYQYLQDHPELTEHFPFTMMAWISEEEDVEFYRQAWDASIEEGYRIRVTPENAPDIRSADKGNFLYAKLTKIRDTALAQAAARFGEDSARYHAYGRDLDDWFATETYQLGSEFGPYWAWGYDRNVGDVTRPTPRDMMDEISRAAGYRLVIDDDGSTTMTQQDTAASRYAAELNPQLHGFIQLAMESWREAEAVSLSRGHRGQWWHTSEAEADRRPEILRRWFIARLDEHIATMTDTKARQGAQYIAERVLTPLLAGYDWDDPLVLYTDPPAPPNGAAGDTITP